MKRGGGILAILAGDKPKKKPATDLDDDYEDDDLDDESDPLDDLDDDEEGGEVDGERQEVCDRLFDAFESRDHAALWSALGDAVDLMRGG